MNGLVYLIGALLVDGAMLFFAMQFLTQRERSSARRLFFASIVYLPLLLGLMVCTKL
jgi:protoheme IX farnesyltransferase